ncbi:hypothetical protein OH685_08215 [Acinetobacter pittii]|nr:hypothetical protein OH685_08215 [Acinetobacter pittii]
MIKEIVITLCSIGTNPDKITEIAKTMISLKNIGARVKIVKGITTKIGSRRNDNKRTVVNSRKPNI